MWFYDKFLSYKSLPKRLFLMELKNFFVLLGHVLLIFNTQSFYKDIMSIHIFIILFKLLYVKLYYILFAIYYVIYYI